MPDTVVGLFRSRTQAEHAVGKLKESGFGPDEVVIATQRIEHNRHYGRKVLIGLGAGAIAGAIVGAFVTGMVPDTHPMISGNEEALFGLSVFTGLGAGGLVGALIAVAASGDESLYYAEELESGRSVVTVSGPRLAEAMEVMLASGAMESVPVDAPLKRPRPESG